jgi:Rap1a immunity proteins
MTKSVLVGAAALALTVTAAQAAEDTYSANSILPGCQNFIAGNRLSEFRTGYCMGIVEGVGRMGWNVRRWLSAIPDEDTGRPAPRGLRGSIRDMLCVDVPAAATVTQMVRVVVAYIEAHPDRMHEDFNDIVLVALRAAWPCK